MNSHFCCKFSSKVLSRSFAYVVENSIKYGTLGIPGIIVICLV